MDIDLHGRTAVVTGGGRGIGLTIAGALSAAGANVAVCDYSQDAIAALSNGDNGIWGLQADAADINDIDRVFNECERRWGPVDILVNNVGIAGPTSWVEETPVDEWEATLRTNLTAAFLCTRRAVPSMKARGEGRIVNISSVAGRLGFPLRLAYSATKWGLIGMTKTLAMELGPYGISVNAVLPGLVANERGERIITAQAQAKNVAREEVLSDFLSRISMRTEVSMEEVAATVTFVCSRFGKHVSGQSISVCGNFETYANPTP